MFLQLALDTKTEMSLQGHKHFKQLKNLHKRNFIQFIQQMQCLEKNVCLYQTWCYIHWQQFSKTILQQQMQCLEKKCIHDTAKHGATHSGSNCQKQPCTQTLSPQFIVHRPSPYILRLKSAYTDLQMKRVSGLQLSITSIHFQYCHCILMQILPHAIYFDAGPPRATEYR